MKTIGIDLGAAQSAGCYDDGTELTARKKYRPVENDMVRGGAYSRDRLEKPHPSFVRYSGAGKPAEAGVRAKLMARTFPKNTVGSIKCLLGMPFSDPRVQAIKAWLDASGGVSVCDNDDMAWYCLGDKKISPEEAAADLIAGIFKDALEQEPGLPWTGRSSPCPYSTTMPGKQRRKKRSH
jgi:molecular chaperone DnaK (HSP70)